MKRYVSVLKNTQLFAGVGEEEIETMLNCLGATLHEYKKGEYVFRAGEHIHNLTVLVKGNLHIQKDDYWGNRAILGSVAVGEMFGEAYVSPDSGTLLNDVVAVEDSSVMFFDIHRILSVCPSACKFHSLTVKNLFFAISEKNRKLVAKLGHISNRTTREKLLSYLSDEAKRNKSASFSIPFNRQQLADFLSVDRSAMSNELGKMRNEGLIQFHKNHFILL
ncbi:MAG: Crp/Fnr family transcriptional regulator [Lachnospiraceae bacterium]